MASPPRKPARRGPAVLAALLLTALACTTPQPQQERAERRDLTMEMFQELLEKGTLTPVDSMEEAFQGIEPEMGETPEERAQDAARGAQKGAGTEGAPAVAAEPEPFVEPPFNPWREFGARIRVYPSGLIMKPYPVRVGMGKKLLGLLQGYSGLAIVTEGAPDLESQPEEVVHIKLEEKFEAEFLTQNMRASPADAGSARELADWLLVTAHPDTLSEIEFFLDVFAAGAPQIEIEAKIVEWSTRDSFDWGVGPNGGPILAFPEQAAFDTISWSLPNRSGTAEATSTFSAIQDGTQINFFLEALSTYDNVSIISRPKVAVREGVPANIESIDKIPYLEITGVNNSGGFNTKLVYQEVGVRLYVTPRLVGTNTVSLEIDIEASQATGSNVTVATANNEAISTPTISKRTARTTVYLRPGQAVILGGLIVERSTTEERKLPLLGDIPLLGYLFKSSYDVKEKAQILFFLRPRVLEGIDLNRDF